MAVLISIIVLLAVIVGGFFILYKVKNKRPEPDYFEIYKTQDTVPVGKVGVFATSLILPEKHVHSFWHNIVYKIFSQIVPWPFRIFAFKDKGVALYDPAHVHAREEFTPARLVDAFGNEEDFDGTPYIERYRQGQVVWAPPSKRIYLDNGYFIYKGRLGGAPTLCGKLAGKSRLYYYDIGIVQKKLPHWEETFKMINAAFDKLGQKYDNIEFRSETNLFHYSSKQKIFEMLDAGCETIVLVAPMAIYSHFEEFNSSFRHVFEYIEEWEHKHPGKKIKVIMAPQMGDFQPMRQAFVDMLKDRLDTIPEGSDVTVAVTVHGMPWDAFQWEAWLQLAPPYRDKLFEDCKELLETYKFGRTNIVTCQDEFADPIWDPDEKYSGTNRVYWQAINDGYDYVIGLPIEFMAENSDTLFHHALKNYENMENYNIDEPIDYADQSVPYWREIMQGKTHVIYNGVPTGKYQHHLVEALYQAIDSVLTQRQ